MYKCECGREFITTSSYAGHCSHCVTHLGHEPEDRFGDCRAWSRGRTKDTDERVARAAAQQRERIAAGEQRKPFAGMKHSEETKRKMSISARRVAKECRNGWKCGDSHAQNRYELITAEFLMKHGIEFKAEVNIPQSVLGRQGSYYQLDFLINDAIDLEIDGTIHLTDQQKAHDAERDYFVSKRYQVYRIQHYNRLDILEQKLAEFLNMLERT